MNGTLAWQGPRRGRWKMPWEGPQRGLSGTACPWHLFFFKILFIYLREGHLEPCIWLPAQWRVCFSLCPSTVLMLTHSLSL